MYVAGHVYRKILTYILLIFIDLFILLDINTFYSAAFGCKGHSHDHDGGAGAQTNFVLSKAQSLVHKIASN